MKILDCRCVIRVMTLSVMAILLSIFVSGIVVAQKPNPPAPAKAVQQSKKAADLLDLIMARPDQRIPKALLTKAEAVAVFTDVKNVGLIIEGFSYGHGVVSRRLANGRWSSPSFAILRGASIAPQLKANSFGVIMLFMNDKSAEWLLDKRAVVLDRAKAPVAGPVGEIRIDQKEVVPVADVFSYIFDEGHFEGKDLRNMLKNVGITHDNDLNKATYGVKAGELLSGARRDEAPPEVNLFAEIVARHFARE